MRVDYWFCFEGTPRHKKLGVLSGISAPGKVLDSSTHQDGLPKHSFILNAEKGVRLKIKAGVGGDICLKPQGNDLGPCKWYLSNLSPLLSMKDSACRKIWYLGPAPRFTNYIVGHIALPRKSLPIKTLMWEVGNHEVDIPSVNVYWAPTVFPALF